MMYLGIYDGEMEAEMESCGLQTKKWSTKKNFYAILNQKT